MNQTILHIALSDFLVTAAEKKHRDLRGRPFVIALPGERIMAASPPAREMGITKGMHVKDVQKRFPGTIIQPYERKIYTELTNKLSETAAQHSPIIEPHFGRLFMVAWLSRRAKNPPEDLAWYIQKSTKKELDITPSVGIGSNKLISFTASIRAQYQREIITVREGDESKFIAPFGVSYLPHANWQLSRELININLNRAGDVQQMQMRHLQELFGNAGKWIYREAFGIDLSPVIPPTKKPGIFENATFSPPTNDGPLLESCVHTLLERLARQLRAEKSAARHITLTATYADNRYFSKSRVMPHGSDDELSLFVNLYTMLEQLLARRIAIKRLGITLSRFVATGQTDLFVEKDHKRVRLLHALDKIVAKHGEKKIYWASRINWRQLEGTV